MRKEKEKKLAERWHHCPCGALAQRDLFRTYLESDVNKETLDISQAKKAWVAGQPLLQRAISKLKKQVIGTSRLASSGLGQRQSLSHAKENMKVVEAIDVVGKEGNFYSESYRETACLFLKPPVFIRGGAQHLVNTLLLDIFERNLFTPFSEGVLMHTCMEELLYALLQQLLQQLGQAERQ